MHPISVAATRLRTAQYEPAFRAHGFDVALWTLFAEPDLSRWYGRSQIARALVLAFSLRRVWSAIRAIRSADLVIVQREALPLGLPLLESYAARRAKLVWDVDDAVWVDYVSPTAGKVPRWLRTSGHKFERLCAAADEVWAGSEVLAAWCRQHNDRVRVVPTVVEVPASVDEAVRGRVVAWIGSHSTGPFLEEILPALAAVEPPPQVLVVGAAISHVPEGLPVRSLPWSPETEQWALSQARVGLYPIDERHPLAQGKCGLKAILYMAHGIPPVVTPTTTNARVVRDGREGLHADNAEEWTAAVQRLLDDDDLWTHCREAARERALREYSLQSWRPIVADRAWSLVMAL